MFAVAAAISSGYGHRRIPIRINPCNCHNVAVTVKITVVVVIVVTAVVTVAVSVAVNAAIVIFPEPTDRGDDLTHDYHRNRDSVTVTRTDANMDATVAVIATVMAAATVTI